MKFNSNFFIIFTKYFCLIWLGLNGINSYAQDQDSLGPILSHIIRNKGEPPNKDKRSLDVWFNKNINLFFDDVDEEIRRLLRANSIAEAAFMRYYLAFSIFNPKRYTIEKVENQLKGQYSEYVYQPSILEIESALKLILIKSLINGPSSDIILVASDDFLKETAHNLIYSEDRLQRIPEQKFVTLYFDITRGLEISISEDSQTEQQQVVLNVSLFIHQEKGTYVENYRRTPSNELVMQWLNAYYDEIMLALSAAGITNLNRSRSQFYDEDTIDRQTTEGSKDQSYIQGHFYLQFDPPSLSVDLVRILRNVLQLPSLNPKTNIPAELINNPETNSCSHYLKFR